MYLTWGVIIVAAAAWFALIIAPRKHANRRVQVHAMAQGLIVLLGLWALLSYGGGLVRWASHSMSYEVDLRWDAPSVSARPISGYDVYRAEAGSSAYRLLNRTIITRTQYVDTTVKPGRTYNYIVKSVDALTGVESGSSNITTATVPWVPHFSGYRAGSGANARALNSLIGLPAQF